MSELIASRTVDLALLVDLEARWENLRSGPTNQQSTHQDLARKQRAYDAFQTELVKYNKKYPGGYVSAFHRNTPLRLAVWLRKMRDLYRPLDTQVPSPAHLLEKAYRSADVMAVRAGKERFSRAAAVETARAAVAELEALAGWCDGLDG